MGATKKYQMLVNEFEAAIEQQDVDAVFSIASQILAEMKSLRVSLETALGSNHHGKTPEDMELDGYKLVCTSFACPEQYDVLDADGKQVGYLRLRGGYFRADAPDCGGETVYAADTKGDGIFEDDERLPELRKAVAAIKNYHMKGCNSRVMSVTNDTVSQ